MKIYFAGSPGAVERERNWLRLISRRLLSYWAVQQNQFGVRHSIEMIKEKNIEDIRDISKH